MSSLPQEVRIAVIGGSGLTQLEGLTDLAEVMVETPFGLPSGPVSVGLLAGQRVAFLPRHGVGHRLNPSEIPFRANIYLLKMMGVERIVAVSAVGSLQPQYAPSELVVPDQFVDRTVGRVATFFNDGIVAHISFAKPICPQLAACVADAGDRLGIRVHRGGTYLCIEGPALSTQAESRLFRSWGMDIIGMTNITEARLAREAEICYSTLAMVTDYDCWHPDHEFVTAEMVVQTMQRNLQNVRKILGQAIGELARLPRQCDCGNALRHALMTAPERITAAVKTRLAAILPSECLR